VRREKYKPFQQEFNSIISSLKRTLLVAPPPAPLLPVRNAGNGFHIQRRFAELSPKNADGTSAINFSPAATRNVLKGNSTTTLDLGSGTIKEENEDCSGLAPAREDSCNRPDARQLLANIKCLAESINEVKKENIRIETDIQSLEQLERSKAN
jgi:hypothetical protein